MSIFVYYILQNAKGVHHIFINGVYRKTKAVLML